MQQISGLVEERMEDCLLMGEGWLINGLGEINGLFGRWLKDDQKTFCREG